MKPIHLVMIFGTAAVLTIGAYFAGSKPQPQVTPIASAPSQTFHPPAESAINAEHDVYYFFDVHGHSAEEITELLKRAKTTYDRLSSDLQAATRIAMVLHGPDVVYFANGNYAQYKALVDLAAEVDAFGFLDLKVCAASARSQGLEADKFPPFVELVAYGPAEIRRLEAAGYVRL